MAMSSYPSEAGTKRAATAASQIAQSMATAADSAAAGGRWTSQWDAVGSVQPHDPTTASPWAGLNRYILLAGQRAVPESVSGAWATAEAWTGAGLHVKPDAWGVVVLASTGGRLHPITVHNASQVAGGPTPQHPQFATPPPMSEADVDRMFGVGGDSPSSSESDPSKRASQLAAAAVARAGHRMGALDWASPQDALAAALATQIVVNALGFDHSPDMPPPDTAAAWSMLLRSPTGGEAALAVAADASRLGAAVVEQIAERHAQVADPTRPDRSSGPDYSHLSIA